MLYRLIGKRHFGWGQRRGGGSRPKRPKTTKGIAMEPFRNREPAKGAQLAKRATAVAGVGAAVGRPAKQGPASPMASCLPPRSAMADPAGPDVWGDVLSLHIADCGGEDVVSYAERSIIRRIATITTELEWIEQDFKSSRKGPTAEQLDLYLRGSNNLRRLLETIGLERRCRDVTPTLSEYLAQRVDDDHADVEIEGGQ
jgi:hypothetical protein